VCTHIDTNIIRMLCNLVVLLDLQRLLSPDADVRKHKGGREIECMYQSIQNLCLSTFLSYYSDDSVRDPWCNYPDN